MNDYVQSMRKLIGNQTLLTIGCGAIIEDDRERILLQSRTDYDDVVSKGGSID